ncbi:MAG: 2-amino-4-hydroxy-6-hydroxymethyldihydropteridine diphosphokinase [Acidimicrobiia bacterium]
MTTSTATVALGSNLGDRLGQLRAGVEGLRRLGEVVAVSALYETDPVGGPDQGPYLNAVVEIATHLEPEDLLAELHRIEGDSERTRDVLWGPRTLDLDLITFDNRVVASPHLQVPHPRAHERRFVLAPLLDVAPDVRLADGTTPAQAIARVQDQGMERWAGDWINGDPELGAEANWWVFGQFGLLTGWLVVVLLTARPEPSVWLVPGALLTLAGLGVGIAAVVSFGTAITPSPQPRAGADLVDRGVYGLVRHPMYGAILCATLGVGIAARSVPGIVMSGLLAGLLRLKSEREERILGIVVAGYGEYRRRVSRRFVPWIW